MDSNAISKNSIWPVPTRRLFVVLLALVALSLLFQDFPWLTFALDAVVILIGWLDFLFVPKLRSFSVTREFKTTAHLGEDVPITWQIRNKSKRFCHLQFGDSMVGSLRASQSEFAAAIAPDSVAEVSALLRPQRRGWFVFEEWTIRVRSRLGLFARQGRCQTQDKLKVYPKFASRRETMGRLRNPRLLQDGLRSMRSSGGGTEFEQLREFGPDDEFRFIDWLATARAGKTMVRTYRTERNQEVVILLDAGRHMAAAIDDYPRLDHAFDATLALTTIASHLGDKVSLMAFSDTVQTEMNGKAGSNQFGSVSEAIFDVEPNLVESDYQAAFVHTLLRHRRRSLIVLVTDLGVQASSGTLQQMLPLISQRHEVIVAGVNDPRVVQWATAVPTEQNKAFRKVSAIEDIQHRQAFKAGLISRGARVIDADPNDLAGAIVDAYLDIKGQGIL